MHVGDHTETAKVTLWESLWESNVSVLNSNSSYKLDNSVVREYNGKKFLSMPREGARCWYCPEREQSDELHMVQVTAGVMP